MSASFSRRAAAGVDHVHVGVRRRRVEHRAVRGGFASGAEHLTTSAARRPGRTRA